VDERRCVRCGINRDLPTKRSGRKDLCKGCRVKVEHVIRYAKGEVCLAWRGDFDAEDNPVHNGKLFMPGDRSCGHRDCINPEHIEERTQDGDSD